MPQRSSTPRWTRGLRPRPEAPLIAAFEPPPGHSAVPGKCGTPGRLERPRLVAAHGLQPLLLHAARLALAPAQVVELGPAYLGLLHHLDLLDRLRVHREDAFHPLAEGDLAHGDGGPGPVAPEPDHDAFEDLDALALGLLVLALLPLPLFLHLGLLDPHVHAHGVARVEAGEALLEVGSLDLLDGIHFSRPICGVGWLACPGPGLRPGPSRIRSRARAGVARPPEKAAPRAAGRGAARGWSAVPPGGARGGFSRGPRRAAPRARRSRAPPPDGCSGASPAAPP